jgi:hypothetical protein
MFDPQPKPLFAPPSSYSWPIVIFMYALGIATGVLFLGPSIVPRTWQIVPESQLITSHGRFLTSRLSNDFPYVFVADSGGRVDLGCLPQAGQAFCLNSSDLRYLASRSTTVGYYYVENFRHPKLSNILMTVSENGVSLMGYETSHQRLLAWSVKQRQIDHSLLTVAAGAFFPIFIIILATWVTVGKLKSGADIPKYRRGG